MNTSRIIYHNGVAVRTSAPASSAPSGQYPIASTRPGRVSAQQPTFSPGSSAQQPVFSPGTPPQIGGQTSSAAPVPSRPQPQMPPMPLRPIFIRQPQHPMVPPMACPPPPCGGQPPPPMSTYTPDRSRPITNVSHQQIPIGGGGPEYSGCSIFGNQVRANYGDVAPIPTTGYVPGPPPRPSPCQQAQATNGFGSPDGLGHYGLFGCKSC
jgi:hypothetical protein